MCASGVLNRSTKESRYYVMLVCGLAIMAFMSSRTIDVRWKIHILFSTFTDHCRIELQINRSISLGRKLVRDDIVPAELTKRTI